MCSVIASRGSPAALAMSGSARLGVWTGAQTSTRSFRQWAVAFCGSIVACAWNGSS